ncbi:ABC transporter ATP-binding protein [Kerstersia gyiorum]|uniref:ABC transporter ATP-binding protein n=1 Tax=Kerstersia gyiorum TaxID=206506 RepID=UPI0020A0B1C1|nr:ABC transporter ATP-binding protein [Kerstersia gyiorum]MCP1632064.1 NitT/TauT family transport system ATP-binding protein [Kerstersia gyiorum]MCP1681214.1 NitT/TauT family transport system ATP-binding protein [Kerstersia gyiorum]MCP1716880.1 NitT/TauT family transport system ATP-binding protein [Kerstersia gyiorum]MCW2185581.1 NitT/TauT family transport system ATP-binding protein [Kerstersia gyiorum]
MSAQAAGQARHGAVKIRFQQVRKEFLVRAENGTRDQRFVAVDGLDLEIHAGEFLVLLDGVPIRGPARDRGVVFQQYALFPWRTALDNVAFGLEVAGLNRRQRREQALHYLDLVGLGAFASRYPHELSGGMKQRVAIARSLAYDPQVLLMDEPFAALDAQTRETLQEELVDIWQRTGKTIVFITHGIDEAVVLGQRVAVMTSRPGRIKHIVDIPDALRADVDDVRSLPLFGELRHEIWTQLHDEISTARQARRERIARQPLIKEPSHV